MMRRLLLVLLPCGLVTAAAAEDTPAVAPKTPQTAPAPAKEGTPKERYIRLVTEQVEKKWRFYLKMDRLSMAGGQTYGSLQVEFYVNKQGKVEDLRIINDKKSNPSLTAITQRAIYTAEIPPMPADVIPLLPMNSPDRLKIEYNALIH